MVYNMCVLSKKVGGREEKRLENARQLRHDSGMKKDGLGIEEEGLN